MKFKSQQQTHTLIRMASCRRYRSLFLEMFGRVNAKLMEISLTMKRPAKKEKEKAFSLFLFCFFLLFSS